MKLDELARVLTLWMKAHAGELPRTLAIDRKTIRDHLGLIVTLVLKVATDARISGNSAPS